MAELRPFEFFLLRYVPDAVAEEFVNIGLVMSEPGWNPSGFADVRFTRDWQRLRCLDPQADVEVLEALEREIRGQLGQLKDRGVLLRWLEDSSSNVIQLSHVKGCLAEDPILEVETLASLYLERRRIAPTGRREAKGRQLILNLMREAFERAGVWELLDHGVPAGPYMGTDDSSKFDFGYRVGEQVKLFHAVSLKTSVDAAISLTSRYEKVNTCTTKLTTMTPMLTAVIDDDLDWKKEQVHFTLNAMRRERIAVAPVAEMPAIAELARRELRA